MKSNPVMRQRHQGRNAPASGNATSFWRGAAGPRSCPGGTSDNSPTFQRWEPVRNMRLVPKGWLNEHANSTVPSGLTAFYRRPPNVETLSYCRTSLRDEDEKLVALPVLRRTKV